MKPFERGIDFSERNFWDVGKNPEILGNAPDTEGNENENGRERIRPIRYENSEDVQVHKEIFGGGQSVPNEEENHEKKSERIRPIQYEGRRNIEGVGEKRTPDLEDSGERQEERYEISKSKEHEKENVGMQRIRPIEFVSEEADQMARTYCEKIVDCPDFLPFLAHTFEEYRKIGGEIKNLMPAKNNCSKKGSLNFSLELERLILNINDAENGEEINLKYAVQIEVFLDSGKVKEYHAQVPSDKIKDFNWLKKATDCMAAAPLTMRERKEFQTMIQVCIEKEDVPHEIIYPNAGWREVPNKGWRYVYGEGVVGEKTNFVHAASPNYNLVVDQNKLGTRETFLNAMGMLSICKTGAASSELFLFVHATMLATLFEKAGHRINFLFGVSGVTNSRKTSMALAIAKVFGRTDPSEFKADAQFAIATRGGIEATLGTYKDAPVIIDDFKPGANKQEQKEMDRKLDELARFYGDGIIKKRMTGFLPDKEKRFFPIYGGCVLTMEIVTGVLSSVTRMFITEINVNEVNNKKLKHFQDNLEILPTHIYDFLAWATDNFDEIILCISEKFKEIREEFKFEVARYAEMYSTLKVTALLLSEYAKERGFWDEEDQKNFVCYIQEIVSQELFSMGIRLKKYDKSTLLLKVIEDMMRNATLTIYSLTSANCANGESCYEDEIFYYIQTKTLMQTAQNFCTRYNERDQIVNENELISLLEKTGLLDIRETNGKRERSRKLPTPKGNTKRYLYIKKGKLNELLDQLE